MAISVIAMMMAMVIALSRLRRILSRSFTIFLNDCNIKITIAPPLTIPTSSSHPATGIVSGTISTGLITYSTAMTPTMPDKTLVILFVTEYNAPCCSSSS